MLNYWLRLKIFLSRLFPRPVKTWAEFERRAGECSQVDVRLRFVGPGFLDLDISCWTHYVDYLMTATNGFYYRFCQEVGAPFAGLAVEYYGYGYHTRQIRDGQEAIRTAFTTLAGKYPKLKLVNREAQTDSP